MLRAPPTLNNDQMALWEALGTRLVTLDERVWEGNAGGPAIENWLQNFVGRAGANADLEKLHALYLLSQFMYYGAREIRVLLKALYRELFLLPLARNIRATTNSEAEFQSKMEAERAATRFLGVGNPSESGVHLLYYFRQENMLGKNAFLDSAQIYTRATEAGVHLNVPRHRDVKRYIFLDDMCGTGETAVRYSADFLPDLIGANPDVELYYFSLFATTGGLDRVRKNTVFGQRCGAIYELDDSYKWANPNSRYLSNLPACLDSELLVGIAKHYGAALWPDHPLGYESGELLLGFFHNTPDNTLPVIWCELQNGSHEAWYPIFRRYPKI
jgi:hypothetical protein